MKSHIIIILSLFSTASFIMAEKDRKIGINCSLISDNNQSKDWPWLVKLYEQNKTQIEMKCGDSIITATIVVTVKSTADPLPITESILRPPIIGVYHENPIYALPSKGYHQGWPLSKEKPLNKWIPTIIKNESYCPQLACNEIEFYATLNKTQKFKTSIETLTNYSSVAEQSIEQEKKKHQSTYFTIFMARNWLTSIREENDDAHTTVLYLKILHKIRTGRNKKEALKMSPEICFNLPKFDIGKNLYDISKLEIEHGNNVLGYLENHINLPIVKYLINNGANINSLGGMYKKRAIIHRAVEHGNLEILKYLVENNANLYIIDEYFGDYIIHIAAHKGHIDILKYLIMTLGYDINIKNIYKYTALHRATLSNQLAGAKFLISKGANINIKGGSYNESALHIASWFGIIDIIKLLLFYDAKIHIKDNRGWTPLHKAASVGHIEAVKYLVTHGGNIKSRDNEGWTVLHSAAWNRRLDIVKYLLSIGADIHAKNIHGETSLHKAADTGDLELVKYLIIEANADFTMKDNRNRTPLDVARYSWNGKIIAEWLETYIITQINNKFNL